MLMGGAKEVRDPVRLDRIERRRRRLGSAIRPADHVTLPYLRRPPVQRVRREHAGPKNRDVEASLAKQALDAFVKAAQRVGLLEEQMRRLVRRRQMDDATRLIG